MSDASWELFDSLFQSLMRQAHRIEELETRCTELERRLREREPEATRSGLKLIEPQPETAERAS